MQRESMVRLAAALGLLCSVSTAAWGERLPSAIEFRTAYCIPMIKWSLQQLDDQQGMLEIELVARRRGDLPAYYAGVSDGSLRASLESSQKQSARERLALHRLQRYLEPLIPGLDPAALRAAAQRAAADTRQLAELTGKCRVKCVPERDYQACLMRQCDGKDLWQRFAGCRNPNWLKH
jgi:hypothetical protein